jgi:hypothetical protein
MRWNGRLCKCLACSNTELYVVLYAWTVRGGNPSEVVGWYRIFPSHVATCHYDAYCLQRTQLKKEKEFAGSKVHWVQIREESHHSMLQDPPDPS